MSKFKFIEIIKKLDNISTAYKDLLIIFATTIIWLLSTGYSCIRSDCHDFYVPIIKYFTNSNYFVSDPFILHSSTKPYLFYRLIAAGSHYINLQILMFLLLIVADFILLYSTFQLSHILTKNRHIAFTSVFLMMFISGGTLAFSYPQQVVHAMTFVTPFLFLALVYYLKGNVKISFFIAGLMFNLHPISSLLLIFLIGFDLILAKIKYPIQLLQYGIVFTIPAIPTIIQLIRESPISDYKKYQSLWLKIVAIRSPHHLFPIDWPISIWIPFVIFIILTFVGFRLVKTSDKKRQILNFCVGIELMSLSAVLFSEIIPIVPFIQLTLFRSTVFFKFLAIPFIAYFIHGKLSKNFIYIILFCILFFLSLLNPQPIFDFYIALFSIVIILFDKKILRHPLIISILTSLVLMTSFPYIEKHIKPGFVMIFDFIGGFMMILILFKRKTLYTIIKRVNYIQWLYITLLSTILFSFSVKGQSTVDIYGNLDNRNPTRQIAIQMRKLTSISSVLITPPYENGFQADTERTIVGDWKDGGLAIWDLPYSTIWWDRMVALSGKRLNYCTSYDQCLMTLKNGYDSLTKDQFIELAKEYKASFIISHNQKLNLPQFIKKDSYIVYDVRNLN